MPLTKEMDGKQVGTVVPTKYVLERRSQPKNKCVLRNVLFGTVGVYLAEDGSPLGLLLNPFLMKKHHAPYEAEEPGIVSSGWSQKFMHPQLKTFPGLSIDHRMHCAKQVT